jgi:hypothetical protein
VPLVSGYSHFAISQYREPVATAQRGKYERLKLLYHDSENCSKLVAFQFLLLRALLLNFLSESKHLFWEINVTFNSSRILSEVPQNKNCPVYLDPDHSSCIAHKA